MDMDTPKIKKYDKNFSSEPLRPEISQYSDYRRFLSDFYDYKRTISSNQRRPYNYGTFSAAANIKSPTYLKLIIEGKRNLSFAMSQKFSRALGLSKPETEEFWLLVKLTQSYDPGERNAHLRELNDFRVDKKIESGEISGEVWEKLPSWISWVLYTMVDQEGVSFDVMELKSLLGDKAKEEEIRQCLHKLFMSGDLVKSPESGGVQRGRVLMESAEKVPVALVRKLQAQLMYLGLEALYKESPKEREIGALTLSLSASEFEDLRFKLRQWKKSIHKDNSIRRMASKGDRVYQLNFQLFPISKSSK